MSKIHIPHTREAALQTAEMLLDIKAVNLRPQQPYILTSGWASPTYVDCRKVISFPKVRRAIAAHMADIVTQKLDKNSLTAIAGGETAGIPYAAWVAENLDMPMLYIRKKPKGHGRGAQIEGDFKEGQKTVLVEDMATDGGSKVLFVDAIRNAGMQVTDSIVTFYYGAFPSSGALEQSGIHLHYLASWPDILEVAESKKLFSPEIIAEVRKFLSDPVSWSKSHGGADLTTAKIGGNAA